MTPWIVRSRPEPQAQVSLLCFPYAGGSSMMYRAWSRTLSPSIDVCAVELPGHGARVDEPLVTRLDALLDALVPAIAPILDRPVALFGYSMGSLVAFELARRLEERGVRPLHLFVAARSPPQCAGRAQVHALPRPEFLRSIERLGGTPPELFRSRELLDLFVPVLRADIEMVETHVDRPGPLLACPITAFGGSDDPHALPATMPGWGEHTRGDFAYRELAGGHFFLRGAEREVLDVISRSLSRECDPSRRQTCA